MSSLKDKVKQHKDVKRKVSKSSPSKSTEKVTLQKYFLGTNRKVSLKYLIDAYLSTHPEFILKTPSKLSRNKLVGFHPSGLHNNCPRRIAFGLIHEKNLFLKTVKEAELDEVESWITPKLRRTFDTGHMIHSLIQYGYLPDMKKKYKVEIPNKSLFAKYLIGGTADITMLMQDIKEWVLDIKTMKQEMFMKLDEKNYGTVQTHYLVQILLYMYGLKITRGGIVYWNKNTGDIKEFYFSFPNISAIKPFIQNELEISLKGKAFLSGKKVPILRECEKQTGRYDKCEYSTVCFRCVKPNDLLNLTVVKKHSDFMRMNLS